MDESQRPLRLLSLDGGGIRGLSSLYILKSIMTAAQRKDAKSIGGLLYPYQYFDLIAGTSTGGLIAVMLGVLQMDLDTCIKEYLAMAPKIFPVEGIFSGSKLGKFLKIAKGEQRFDPTAFEKIIKKLIAEQLKTRSSDGENTPLRFEASKNQPCKVFVCVTSEKLRKHFRFRSYQSSRDVTDDCFIWEACRATSAAPTFFPPMLIGNPATAYVDGGMGYNNPIRPLMEEAVRTWPERSIGCIVSIGTGVPRGKDVGRKIRPLFETLKDMSVDTEKVAQEFREDMRSRHPNSKIYFRFNVEHGLERIGLEEWKEFDRTKVATEDYLNQHWDDVDLCASQICNPTGIPWVVKPSQVKPSSSNVPFPRDPKFVKRDDIIAKVDSILHVPGSHNRAALHGLGGIGKSQIAIEYSYLIQAKTPGLWIFWVYASNSSRVEQSFRDIAAKTDLPGHDDLQVDIFPLVSRWLEDNRNGSWLMILDNADDSQLFLQPLSKKEDSGSDTANFKRSLLSFIPQLSHGKVLITSRDRTAAYDLVGNHDNLVKVDPMNVSESLSLLKTKLHIDPAMENDAIELLDTLEYMPLAITQAGAYIRQLAPLMTLQGYLSQFRKNMANQATLLKKNTRDIRRDETVSNSIIVTWEISFNQISEQHRPAADLLSLMSMFHRQSIPDFLLREDADEYLAFLDRLNLLINFSLISVESEGNLFHMHRLVQMATRKWLEANQSLQKWKRIATERIATIFPKGAYENLEKGELLWPHAEEVIIYEPLDDESKVLYSGLLSLTANHAHAKGNLALAAQRFEQSLVIKRQILGEEDVGFLNCMGNLATILIYQGRWKEAEEMHAHIVQRKKRVLGAEHPDTLTSMSNLASIFWCQGQWKEAEELEMQVLNTRKRVLGAEHPDILLSISSLASTFGSQGRWEEAEELEMQVLNTRKRILGAEHPDTLISMSNLALTFAKQGRWKESGELEMQALNMMKKVLGAEHPDTLTSMNNLAIAYCHQQRHDEAIEWMKSVIDLSTKKLGPNHPDTLISIQWLDHWLEKKVKSEDRDRDKEKGDKSESDEKNEKKDQGGDQDDDDSEHNLDGRPKTDI